MGGENLSPGEEKEDEEYFGPDLKHPEEYDFRDNVFYPGELYKARTKTLLDRMSLPRVLQVIDDAIKCVGYMEVYIEEQELKTILQYELPRMERERFNDKNVGRITKGMVSNLVRLLRFNNFLDHKEIGDLEKKAIYYKLTHNAKSWYE